MEVAETGKRIALSSEAVLTHSNLKDVSLVFVLKTKKIVFLSSGPK